MDRSRACNELTLAFLANTGYFLNMIFFVSMIILENYTRLRD